METWVLVQNPNAGAVSVDVNFMTSTGNVPGPQDYNIPGNSRVSFDVSNYVTDYNVSTKVASTGGDIICERAVYGNGRQWGHDSIGATSPEAGWCFAEGCTLGEMETWILVQNPMNYAQDVIIFPMGDNIPPDAYIELSLPANSRVSTDLGLFVDSYNVSTTVLTWDSAAGSVETDGKIVCERAMYDTSRTWGHDSVGSPFIYPLWVLPEGSTGGGMETWILVQNPTNYDGAFDMIFMTDDGIVPGPAGRSHRRRLAYLRQRGRLRQHLQRLDPGRQRRPAGMRALDVRWQQDLGSQLHRLHAGDRGYRCRLGGRRLGGVIGGVRSRKSNSFPEIGKA